MNLTKLLESRVGSHGIKFNPILALQAKLQLDADVAQRLNLPRSEVKDLLYLAKEQQLEQAIERLTTTWRWWGDSLGYFNRKSDAHTFYQELKLAMHHGLLWPSLQQWQNTGLFSVHGVREQSTGLFYIDPETHAAKVVPDSHTYPVIHPAVADTTFATGMYIRLLPDDENSNAQLVKLAVVVADISLCMASFPAPEVAVETDAARPLRLDLIGDIDPAQLESLATTAQITSAELAAALPEFPSHQPATEVKDKYLEFLVRKFGMHNQEIALEPVSGIPYLASFSSDAVLPAVKPQAAPAPVEVEIAQPIAPSDQTYATTTAAEMAEAIAEEILAIAEPPILDLPQPQVAPVTYSTTAIEPTTAEPIYSETPIASVAVPQPSQRPPDRRPPESKARKPTLPLTHLIHKVKISGSEIVIASSWQDSRPVEVHSVVYKSPAGFQGELNTLNKLVNLHLQSRRDLNELWEALSGENFGPGGNTDNPQIPTCTSVADYIGQWLINQTI